MSTGCTDSDWVSDNQSECLQNRTTWPPIDCTETCTPLDLPTRLWALIGIKTPHAQCWRVWTSLGTTVCSSCYLLCCLSVSLLLVCTSCWVSQEGLYGYNKFTKQACSLTFGLKLEPVHTADVDVHCCLHWSRLCYNGFWLLFWISFHLDCEMTIGMVVLNLLSTSITTNQWRRVSGIDN